MAKLKGKKKLNKVIKKQLAPFGIDKVLMETEFAYYADNTIAYTPVINDYQGQAFINFIERRFDFTTKMPFMLFLLHEVGHHVANENIIDDVAEFCDRERERIDNAMESIETEEELEKINEAYFNLPDEIMASQWAVNYMKKHPRITKKMWLAIAEEMDNFYKKNEVETT